LARGTDYEAAGGRGEERRIGADCEIGTVISFSFEFSEKKERRDKSGV
jgi:hypothetical protein